MNDAEIADLRAKAEAASPGPWATTLQWIYQEDKQGIESLIITTLSDANAEYVAAFDPPTVLSLMHERDVLYGVIEALRLQIDTFERNGPAAIPVFVARSRRILERVPNHADGSPT